LTSHSWTHSDLSADGLGRHLGRWENVRSEAVLLCPECKIEADSLSCPGCSQGVTLAWRSVGDFVFDESAHKLRPDGLDVPAPVYLMDRADEDPQGLGISVVAHFALEEATAEGNEPKQLARIESKGDLLRGDWVADPAANPIGLHAGTNTPSELTEGATRALDRLVTRLGSEQAKTRALAFLARYFGDAFGEESVHAEASVPPARPEALRARVDALQAELEGMRETVVAYRAAERARRQSERQAFMVELRTRAAELNAPIKAKELAQIQKLLESGNLEAATLLKDALLACSSSQGQVPFERSGSHSVGEDHDQAKASVAARARLLRRRGWTVELSEDGAEILKETPPSAGGGA